MARKARVFLLALACGTLALAGARGQVVPPSSTQPAAVESKPVAPAGGRPARESGAMVRPAHAPGAVQSVGPSAAPAQGQTPPHATGAGAVESAGHGQPLDFVSMLFVFMLATFIGVGVIMRVSRLLHTPLMSLTNAISAIAVVGAIIVSGGQNYPPIIRVLGAVALFASMTNIVSGFLITDRMLKMFKTREVRK